ncbi:glycosyltransferase N-terminal domain-containing protein [Draconibacterium sp. IB214405]|uniref:3-deoxy-D-manno-octulosonic acid transferase n=1 Tax=Draconibacterium sp. IB214405 TaxID=3097352 RepID=UPI002A149FB7|nr:glycosyltransferase N-terminal domain-containing protein [Draconibacterium sp. IB214405]MDX8337639.1 glycosyltransferase N-terminal domain-containing protein [Draconibacterium sp. IB214405]
MSLLYNLGILFYGLFIRVAALFNEKAKLFVAGRKNWKQKLESAVDKNASYIWLHCASLGEFEQGRPVLEEIKKRHPKYKLILTFFSPSGYEIRKNYEGADIVAYLPMDTKKNAKDFIKLVQPEKVFFVKYEFWYNYITELKRQQIPLYIISAIFRENQQFFKSTPWGKWYRKMLHSFEHIFIQNENSAQLLEKAGITHFTVSGDTRFDRVAEIARGAKKFNIVEKFRGNNVTLIAGSTWKPDEELLAAFINNSNNVKFIIAPHEVAPANINRIQELLKKPAICFSKAEISNIDSYDVLIIDSIGILSSLYQYGNIAYIGGGFGVGIHNILEAATFKLPVLFGPNYLKFKEAVDLVAEKGAFPIQNFNELEAALNKLLNDEMSLQNASEICKKYIEKNVGSTKLIINKVFNNHA